MMNISVCIPTYNQGLYLEKTIRSALNQTLLPTEIIVFNDCSTDNTREILDKLVLEIPILKVFHRSKNVGMRQNENDCMKEGRGEYIVKLDSDDYLLPNYLEKLSNLLDKYKNAGYAHGSIKEIDNKGNFTRDRVLFRKNEYETGEESLKKSLMGYRVAANIIMFRKEALQKVNYEQSNYNFAQDYYLSVDIANVGYGNVYCKEFLACYRVWNDSKNIRAKRKLEEIKGITSVFKDVMTPAFRQRMWDIKKISRAKSRYAKGFARCLNDAIHTKQEKKDLEAAILNLSSTPKVKLAVWAYKHGFGFFFQIIPNIKSAIKNSIKKIILSR